jgi:putative flippase GtrA
MITKYLIVGLFNTIFGFLFGLLSLYIFHIKYGLLITVIFSHIISVSFSFFTFSKFVFLIKKKFLNKFFKFHVTYGILAISSYISLKFLIDFKEYNYEISQALVVMVNILITYFFNTKYNFKD